MLPPFAFAAVLSGMQLVSDMSLGTPRYVPAGAAGYTLIGLAIGAYFTRGDMSRFWPEINAQWNAIYSLLVPTIWLITGRRTEYLPRKWAGFAMISLGALLVN